MQRKIQAWFLITLLLISVLTVGCQRHEREEGPDSLYYLNEDATGLTEVAYTIQGENPESQAEQILQSLKSGQEKIELIPAIPQSVPVNRVQVNRGVLTLDLGAEYQNLTSVEAVLSRVAIVQSLLQIEGVDRVGITVDGMPLKDSKGRELGYMNEDSFIRNTGAALHSYTDAAVELCFSDETGQKLVPASVNIKYSTNSPLEKEIVNRLVEGPRRSNSGCYPMINPSTKVLSVTTKEGICYVNLDEQFLQNEYDVLPEVTIYSIVNAIVENTAATSVQISINGETNVTYKEAVDLSIPLEKKEGLE